MSAMKQPFRFFDLPKEVRLLVYEHLHMPRSVLQQATGCEIESKYMAFTFGALATCKLMRDEVKPFLAEAYKTGDHETGRYVGAPLFDFLNQEPQVAAIQQFIELVFNSQANPGSEVGEAGL
jgi:hypothetical protein